MDLNDPRWSGLEGGYGVPFDPRPLLRRLAAGEDRSQIWPDLWQELYHQGDVGVGSYAAAAQLCRIDTARPEADWQTYALVASVDLARDGPRANPRLPAWLEAEYQQAIASLALAGLRHLGGPLRVEAARSILAVVALWKGLRTYARLLLELDEDEVVELEQTARG